MIFRYNPTSLHFYKVTRLINIRLNVFVESAVMEVFKNWLDKQILGLFYVGLILSCQWTI